MKKIDIKVVAEPETVFFVESRKSDTNSRAKIQRYAMEKPSEESIDEDDTEAINTLKEEEVVRYGKKYLKENKW
jgi:hypothetical protein